ncbi:MAG: SRPBCC family protein [Solirubrobacterales bacterium]
MTGTLAIECDAPPERVWELISQPGHWPEWSPHVRGAEGLGAPQVTEGAEGRVVLRGGLRLRARVMEVIPDESWTWRVGGLVIRHTVRPLPAGRSRLEHVVEGSSARWSLAARAYAPLVGLIARNIARVAARGPTARETSSRD